MTVEPVDEPEDPRLADYAHLRSQDRRVGLERERGIFSVEGLLALQALLRSGHAVRSVLLDRRRLDGVGSLLADVDAPVYAASSEVIQSIAGFAFHRGVLAVAERPAPIAVDEISAGTGRLLLVEGVNDYENLGALYRNAAAFGVDGVLLDPTTTDPLYRRVVRVSLGHVLSTPTARVDRDEWPAAVAALANDGIVVLALTPHDGAEAIDEVAQDPPRRWALLVGAEGPGLSPGAPASCGSERAHPPRGTGVDSLNVATAAAIALHRLT